MHPRRLLAVAIAAATGGYVGDKQVDPPFPGSYRGLENEEEFAAAAAP